MILKTNNLEINKLFPNKNHLNLNNFFEGYNKKIIEGFSSIDRGELDNICQILEENIQTGNKIFSCGNGGSSSIAEHFVCDAVKGSSTDADIQPIMYSLPSNTALLTAVANDISYEQVFAFQLKKYAKGGDILLAISSSGNSPNIIAAIKMAKSLGLQTISFVGFNGGEAKTLSNYCIHVKVNNYGVVEDIHQSLMHILTQYLRLKYLDNLDDVGKKVF